MSIMLFCNHFNVYEYYIYIGRVKETISLFFHKLIFNRFL